MPVDAVLIAGPTASGKSAAALALAEQLRGVVINANSMQVYSELRILTARPTPADERRAPHLLYGHVRATERYSAGRYQDEAAQALADARERGLLPIFVGGTGLYFSVLTEGLSPIPAVPADVRTVNRRRFETLGRDAFFADLAQTGRDDRRETAAQRHAAPVAGGRRAGGNGPPSQRVAEHARPLGARFASPGALRRIAAA